MILMRLLFKSLLIPENDLVEQNGDLFEYVVLLKIDFTYMFYKKRTISPDFQKVASRKQQEIKVLSDKKDRSKSGQLIY